MISRITSFAAAFAILAAASIAFAASVGHDATTSSVAAPAAAAVAVKTVELERVVINGKRISN